MTKAKKDDKPKAPASNPLSVFKAADDIKRMKRNKERLLEEANRVNTK